MLLLNQIYHFLGNYPPNITADATFRVTLGEESVFLLNIVDPGDNFTLQLDGGLPANSTLQQLTDREYAFIWRLFEITDRTLEFIANDTRGASGVFMPRVELCPCRNGGICTLNGVITDAATVTMNCRCSQGMYVLSWIIILIFIYRVYSLQWEVL